MNKTTERTVEILEYLSTCDKGYAGISTISRELDIPKSSVSDILYTLLYKDYVQYENEAAKTFKLGLKTFYIGFTAVGKINIINIAKKSLTELNEKTGLTVLLGIVNNNQLIIIDKIDKCVQYRLSVEIGMIKETHLTAAGKAILATCTNDEVKYIAGDGCYATHTSNSLSTYTLLLDDLNVTRKRGYAVENFEENNYTYSIGAPLFDMNEKVCGAISVCMLKTDYEKTNIDKLAELLTAAALEISNNYGSHKKSLYGGNL